MKLTTVYMPCDEGGYSAFIEEIPGVNSQGETLEEAESGKVVSNEAFMKWLDTWGKDIELSRPIINQSP